jgi:hypothetical protein
MGDPNKKSDSDDKKDIEKDSSSNPDKDIAKWIKDLTALAGLVAVLVGAWVSVRSLQDKAETDKATAQFQFETAELQARQQQRKFHDARPAPSGRRREVARCKRQNATPRKSDYADVAR